MSYSIPSSIPLYFSAAHKSSGKTTVTLGILSALKHLGYSIQAFKKGPDYIDPIWHSKASQNPCYSLDFNTMSTEEIVEFYNKKVNHAQIPIIEGNKGLYDGIDLLGTNSNAALAKLLDAKVILVLDCNGMTRGVAPLILGYQDFDPNINFAGVIFNQVGGNRHEQKLRQMVEHYTDLSVLGSVHKNEQLAITERHLGLVPSNEGKDSETKINQIRGLIEQQIDLNKIVELSSVATSKKTPEPKKFSPFNKGIDKKLAKQAINIAIMKDSAFGFYYPADLEALEAAGANLITVNALEDKKLPENIHGLFIGGGFPETHMQSLSKNNELRQQIYKQIDLGLPAYAECGGLMYLCRTLEWSQTRGDSSTETEKVDMVGIIPADVVMSKKPQGRGLIQYTETEKMLWPTAKIDLNKTNDKVYNAHEFHYSRLENISSSLNYAYSIKRGFGIDGEFDGIIIKNLLASYAHLQDTKQNHWAQRFIDFIRSKH